MQRFINIFFLTLNFFSKSFMWYLPVAILTDVLYLVEMIETWHEQEKFHGAAEVQAGTFYLWFSLSALTVTGILGTIYKCLLTFALKSNKDWIDVLF